MGDGCKNPVGTNSDSGTNQDPKDYSGTWMFSQSPRPGADSFINKNTLTLNLDSTFSSTFRFYWTQDSTKWLLPLSGKWRVTLWNSDHGDVSHKSLFLTSDTTTLSWDIDCYIDEKFMVWYETPWYHQSIQYKWTLK